MGRTRTARRRRSYVGLYAKAQAYEVISVGALERGDPIPVGVYWIDSIDPEAYADPELVQVAREGYLLAIQTGQPGAYRIVRTTHHDSQLIGDQPARDWILFEVRQPIPRWPTSTQWGFPTIAPNGLDTQEGDTVQKPPPEKGPLEGLGDTSLGIPNWVLLGGGIVLVGVVVYAATR